MNIVTIIDSFKGTMSSEVVSSILSQVLISKGHNVVSIPISDGGEGFVESIKNHFSIEGIVVEANGPFGEKLLSEYILKDKIAYIEMNSAAGLTLIEKNKLNPLATTTYGVGVIALDAIKRGAKSIILGIGGSSTNDGGAGMVQALGVEFFNNEKLIDKKMNGALIGEITSIKIDNLVRNINDVKFIIASDVKNPLLGKNGCAAIYSPQKGANLDQIKLLEDNMTNYAKIVQGLFKNNYSSIEGAGAAGGMGFGCLAFLNAKIVSGINFMINLMNIEKVIQENDVVIVGEGKLDLQTKNGKAPSGIAKVAKKYNKKVIGLFGMIENEIKCDYIDEVIAVVPTYATAEESMENPTEYFSKMVRDIKI